MAGFFFQQEGRTWRAFQPMSGSGTNRLCELVDRRFCCRGLTGLSGAVSVFLSLTQSRHFENSRLLISSAAVGHELSTADNVVRYPVWAHDRRRRWPGRAALAPRGRSFASRTFRRLRAARRAKGLLCVLSHRGPDQRM